MKSVKLRKKPIHIPNFKCKKIKPKQFPVEKGNYILGNEYSPVAVVIPMPDKELARIAIEAGACIAGHLATANIGIEKVVANIIANPNIRFIILYGRESEGHLSAHSLKMLHLNGIDENGKIIGSRGLTPYIRNLPREAVDRFRKQIIYVIDLIGFEDPKLLRQVVRACIQEPENAYELIVNGEKYTLYDPGAYGEEPMICRITTKLEVSGVYETLTPYSTVIHAKTIASAYSLLIEAILSAGRIVEDERGYKTKELLNVQVHILEPQKDQIPNGYKPEAWIRDEKELREYLDKYALTYMMPRKVVVFEDGKIILKDANVSYTYGDRLTNFNGLNQLKIAINAIRNAIRENRQTRRLVLSLVDPLRDLAEDTEKLEIPCFTQYWVFNRIENDRWVLHATMFLRSHDALRAFPANAYAGAKLLEYLAKETDCKIGTLTMFFGSCHIYLDF
jgi:tetrahydromethanopterin S-methyltransferase subunit A